MKRAALIISASTKELPGAAADAEAWSAILAAPFGGAWRSDELSILSDPRPDILRQRVAKLAANDYALVCFSGHGFATRDHSSIRGIDNYVCIGDAELKLEELRPRVKRSLVIADACRGFHVLAEDIRKRAAIAPLDPSAARLAYDRAIETSETGDCTIFGCGADEAAGESKLGGYFTRALQRTLRDWAERNPYRVSLETLGADDAFAAAKAAIERDGIRQRPEYQAGRRLRHFPMAVR